MTGPSSKRAGTVQEQLEGNGKLSFLHRIEPRHQPSVAVMPITP